MSVQPQSVKPRGVSRMLRWSIVAILFIVVIHFSSLYNSQEEVVENTTLNVPAKNGKRNDTLSENPRTSMGNQKIYNPPEICGKEWQSKYQALHQDIINNRREPKFLVYSCPWTTKGKGEGTQTVRTLSDAEQYQLDFFDSAFENTKALLENRGHTKHAKDGWLTNNTSEVIGFMRKENVQAYLDKPVEIATSNLYFVENGMQRNKQLMQRAKELKISPLLPGSQRYAMIGCAYDFLFKKSPSLQKALENTRNALRANSALVIGIHIRLGDLQFGRNFTRVPESDFQKYFSCAEKIERDVFNLDGNKVNTRQTRWFLAADNVLVKDYARKHFAEKVITAENKPEHLDLFKKGEKPPSDEGMLGVLHDHFMLAQCDFLVLSESSFDVLKTKAIFRVEDDCINHQQALTKSFPKKLLTQHSSNKELLRSSNVQPIEHYKRRKDGGGGWRVMCAECHLLHFPKQPFTRQLGVSREIRTPKRDLEEICGVKRT
ncbi:hypothetical protein OS493_016137 [Desmophyllum pertusum]|uniref:Alpha-(1,6)-fucosyltransferase N- and catalytic domain-containing protein n=1 Tax=Desmophyllum pertusum TaxID=174260 RepID=A0A9X0A1U6_9CNID|nr:hypothetical protein OS493_016137 [Desmophyllum pertusum]